ncbi:MAG: hypothetical protein ACTSO2_00015 [Promethearchaeota archaeon]
MKRKLINLFVLGFMVFSFLSLIGSAQAAEVQIGTDLHNAHQNAGEEMTYQFRQRTRIRINSSVNVDVNMDVDALNIREKTFSLEIISTEDGSDIELNITARQTESELGIQAGETIRIRARARINYGFAANIKSNASCNAKLGMEMSAEEAKGKTWGYFDEAAEEWVPVDSEYVDGELVAITDHFSTWTIIDTGLDVATIALIGAGAIALQASINCNLQIN